MPKSSPKKLTLRAFRIENPKLSRRNSGLVDLLRQALVAKSTAAVRRMELNSESLERELLANYYISANHPYMFGMMLRVIPAESGGSLCEELFKRQFITMADVNAGSAEQSQYKGHFYFALNNDYLVVDLPGNVGIARLQTYINWLVKDFSPGQLFQFSEMMQPPEGVSLSQIKSIQFGGTSGVAADVVTGGVGSITALLENITSGVIETLLGPCSSVLEQLRDNQLLEARLLIKVKKKPKEMEQDEFQRVMGAVATIAPEHVGVTIHTKGGGKYDGREMRVVKSISVDCISSNRISEEQLKQEMELFLNELK